MTAHELAERLRERGRAVQRVGAGYMAQCPAHLPDNTASLSVAEGADGCVLLYCFAGCDFDAILAELGLTRADVASANGRGPRTTREIEREYVYHTEDGAPLFSVVRYPGKDFRQCRIDADGKRVWNLRGVQRVLYNLPAVLAALKVGETIYVVEGEKDAETLRALGSCATTSPGGAGKWRPEYSETLRGAHVVILPDQDEKGRAHGEAVARVLRGVAGSIRVVHVPAGKDVSEWIERHGGTRDALLALAESARPTSEPPEERIVPVTVEDFLACPIPPREYVVSPWLRVKNLAMLYAWRGTGKTWLGLGLAVAIASGIDFLGWKVPRPRRVLYVDGEMPAGDLQERLARLTVTAPQCEGRLRLLAADLFERGLPNLADRDGQALVEDLIEDGDVLILDSLATLYRPGAAENDRESWLDAQEWLLTLRRRGVTSLFSHHAGKGGAQRGTSAREDVLDVSIELSHPPDYSAADGGRFELRWQKARGLRGDAVQPLDVRVEATDEGVAWTWRLVETAKYDRVRALHAEAPDLSRAALAKELGVSRSTVTRALDEKIA